MPQPEIRTERAVVEELVELLKEHGPDIRRLADHFDNLEKRGITAAASRETVRRRNDPDHPAESLIDSLAAALKTSMRGAGARRGRG
jgi:hypothetical protein